MFWSVWSRKHSKQSMQSLPKCTATTRRWLKSRLTQWFEFWLTFFLQSCMLYFYRFLLLPWVNWTSWWRITKRWQYHFFLPFNLFFVCVYSRCFSGGTVGSCNWSPVLNVLHAVQICPADQDEGGQRQRKGGQRLNKFCIEQQIKDIFQVMRLLQYLTMVLMSLYGHRELVKRASSAVT